MSGEAYPEKRENERLPITLEVNFNTEMEFLNSTTRNISAGGMFIHTLYPLPEGTELNVRFSIPEVEIDFSAAAEVVWAVTVSEVEDEKESGMGIRFIKLDPKKSRMLQRHIEKSLSRK